MMTLRLLGTVLALGLVMGGCGAAFMMPPQTTPLGSAVRTTLTQQIADPEASDRPDTSLRLEGRAGAALMERYYFGFEAAKTQAAPYMILQAAPTGK